MTDAEARILLGVGQAPATAEQLREAYLQRAPNVRLEAEPAEFMGLREAFELLTHGAGAPVEEIAAARDSLAAQPDAEDARWRLLSCLPYAAGPEASSVLRDGAERQPEAFLDELMFHFPDRVPPDLARRARDGTGPDRLLLIADVHATEGRSAESLDALRTTLAGTSLIASPAFLKLALRPIFSLQVHGQIGPAREALGLVRAHTDPRALEAAPQDLQTATAFQIAVELANLDDTFPIDLRQVAARAAKRGDFQNAPYEARYATRLLKPRDVLKLNDQLKRQSPALEGLLGLTLTEDQLRPGGTPIFTRPYALGIAIVTAALYLSFRIHLMDRGSNKDEAMLREVGTQFISQTLAGTEREIKRDCADPDSERCRHWQILFPNESIRRDAGTGASDARDLVRAPTSIEGAIRLEDIGTIGKHPGP